MSKRPIFAILLALTAIFPTPARAADEKSPKSDKPTVILRLAPLDHLRGDLRYLAEVVGEGEKAKQFDEMIKSMLGDKGLAGIDTKKPLGLYGWVGAFGFDSKVVLMVPLADKKAFLDLLSDNLDAKPKKGGDDVYSMSVENVPGMVYFRFANDYVYATVGDKGVLDKGKLLAPASVLPAGQIGALSLTVNVDEVPDELKEKGLAFIENRLAGIKDTEMAGHTEAQKKVRDAAVDELSAQVKSLFNHGGATSLRLDLDRQAGNLALTVSVAGKSGSPLAESIRKWGQIKSRTASLGNPNSALKGELNVSLPAKFRELLQPALQDAEKHALAKAKDENEREVLGTLLQGIMPTLKAAELDTAINVRGPNDNGIYTLLGGIKVKDAAKLEKALRKTAAEFPQKIVNLDAEKTDGIAIHRINPDKNLKASARRTLGDNPIYVAFRDDVLLVSAGDKGLSALKEALSATPATGKLLDVQMALARLIPLNDDKTQAEIGRKVFGDNKNGGRVHLTVEGGNTLTLRFVVEAKVFDYINRVEKAKKQ